MAAMHGDYGLLLAANLHDDVGIGPWENKFDYMSSLMGWQDKTKPVPFTMCTNTTYTFGVEDEVLGSLEDGRIGGKAGEGGMDFWWIDWQQGGNHGGCAGLKQNPTIWTNKIRCTDAKRRAVGAALAAGASAAEAAAVDVGRNMVLARWGGMGSHRYQVGRRAATRCSLPTSTVSFFYLLTTPSLARSSTCSHGYLAPHRDHHTRWGSPAT